MDTPPPTPPAIIQSDDQQAIDTYDRLTGMQSWLSEQQTAMPPLAEPPTPGARERYLAEIHAFWASEMEASPGRSASRRTIFVERWTSALRDLALLRQQDGSLDSHAVTLIRAITLTRDTTPPHIQASEVTFGDATYAGALIAYDDRDADTVVLFMPDSGWTIFSDLQSVYDHVERHVRRMLAWRKNVPGLSHKDTDRPQGLAGIGSRRITGRPGEILVGRMLDLQREKLEQAWLEYALERSLPGRDERLNERVADAVALPRLFDATSMLALRNVLLRKTIAQTRLAKLPMDHVAALSANVDGVDAAWRSASETYASTVRAVMARHSAAGIEALPDLRDYAADMLDSILGALGVKGSARDIQITLDRSSDPRARLESLPALFEGPSPLRSNLLELAYGNVPTTDASRLIAHDADGHVIAALDDATLRTVVRKLDLHTRYPRLVEAAWRTGEDGTLHRETSIELLAARMRFDAADARVSGYLNQAGDRKHLGLSQRGWHWVEAVLDAPEAARRRKVHQLDVAARQVTYKGVPISDVIEVALDRIPPYHPVEWMSSRVYYTPDAPDGVAFREFQNWDEAQRLFFRNPTFSDYLLDRLPAEFAEMTENGSSRRFKAYRRTEWVFGSTEPEGYTPMEATPVSTDVPGNILEAAVDTVTDLVQRNARFLTRSAAEADSQLMIDLLHRRPAEQVVGNVLMGAITAPLHVAPATWRAYDGIREGRYVDALSNVAEAYAAGLATFGTSSSLLGAATTPPRFASFRNTNGSLVTHAVSPTPRFPPARTLRHGTPHPQGVYKVGDKTAIAVDGELYVAHYDKSSGIVTADRGHPLDAKSASAIQRFHHARWQNQRSSPSPTDTTPATDAATAASGRRDLSLYEDYLIQMEKEFSNPLERQTVVHQMDRELVGLPPLRPISMDQRVRFNRAWAQAEQNLHMKLAERPFIQGRFRKVMAEDAPERLWFYGQRPFHQSPFVRLGNYRNRIPPDTWGALIGERQAPGVVGVRVTSVPPESSTAAITAGSVLRHFDRPFGFAVEIRIRDMLRQQTPGRGTLELLEVVGNAGQYILRPRSGSLFEMGEGQFRLVDTMPPVSPMVMAKLPLTSHE